jgi:hypothetical protein
MPLAEGVGFEPTRACALPVFKTGAFDRSATLPLKNPLRIRILAAAAMGNFLAVW